MTSEHNDVVLMEFPEPFAPLPQLAGCRALMVDQTRNIHSVYREDRVLLAPEFYWEHMAIAAAAAPAGPIGILGLGTGTVPRILHAYWPDRKMHGWELDGAVLHAGRLHMGLQQLEDAGALVSHTGDALAPEAAIAGGFSALIVDLFANGAAIPPLHQAEVWRSIRRKLAPGGVCVANIGQPRLAAAAAEHMQAAFADVGVWDKQCSGNLLLLAGADPSQLQVPSELAHILEAWQRRPA